MRLVRLAKQLSKLNSGEISQSRRAEFGFDRFGSQTWREGTNVRDWSSNGDFHGLDRDDRDVVQPADTTLYGGSGHQPILLGRLLPRYGIARIRRWSGRLSRTKGRLLTENDDCQH